MIVDTVTIERLTGLDRYLGSQILGQGEVLQQVTELLQRSFCGIRLPNRPKASMLFLGPTGVGKTETAELDRVPIRKPGETDPPGYERVRHEP